jgi:heme/copper-type cytochrome/quinol oxidase subunit 3
MAVPALPDTTPLPSLLEAPAAPPLRPRVVIVGAALVSAAAGMFVVALVGIYLARRADVLNNGGRWIPKGANFQLAQPTMVAFTLVLSVVTLLWAVHALRIEDRSNAYVALGVTLLLGFAAFNEVTYLLSRAGLAVRAESGLLVLTIVGVWLFWLISAIVFVSLMAFRALGGQYRRIPDGVEAAALYWIAATAVWMVLWVAIFVMK